MRPTDKNTKLLFGLAIVVGLMIGLVSQAAPIYRIFCGATGLGGTTQNVSAAPARATAREVTVTFDGNVDPGLPWDFGPDIRSVRVKLGEKITVNFHARNRSQKTTVGTAVHNVQPDKAGLYFDKLECFCFTKQTLAAGQSEEMPVQFFIDPAMAQDPENDDVQNITLSYTFFPAKPGSNPNG